jgi:hypothetical protein
MNRPAQDGSYPLSFEQSDYLSREYSGFGTIAACSKVKGAIDAGLLAEAARYVVARHEPLRMRLLRRPDGLRQVFADPGMVDTKWLNLSMTDPGQLYVHAAEKLDPERNGPVYLKFLHQDDEQAYLIALLDHLACDGWSAYLFVRELWGTYRIMACGEPPDMSPVRFSYSDYILGQQRLSDRRLNDAQSFWGAHALSFAESDSGLWIQGPASDLGGRADLVAVIEPGCVETARLFARALSLSPNVIPLACIILASWSMTDSDCVGVSFIYGGRDNPRTRFLIGLFRRYVAVVAQDISRGTVADFLASLAKTVFEAIWWSRAPYSSHEFEARVARHRSKPMVDILYNQIDPIFGEGRLGDVQQLGEEAIAEIVESPHFSADRWRGFNEQRLRLVLGGGGRPTMQAIFNEGCVTGSDVNRLLGRTVALLGAMTTEVSDVPVGRFVRSALAGVV